MEHFGFYKNEENFEIKYIRDFSTKLSGQVE